MLYQAEQHLAAEMDVVAWLNTSSPLSLAQLKGKVVVIHAFQMLCPGCVVHGVPQASAISELYSPDEVQVIGIHTVFEHHDVMTPAALKAFIHEYRIAFPVAIDRPSDTGAIPHTMANYQMQGTPTLIVIDQQGFVRLNHFGRMSDMQVGSIIGGLLSESDSGVMPDVESAADKRATPKQCDDDGCSI